MRAPFVLLAAACVAALVMASTALTTRPAALARRLRRMAFWFGVVALTVLGVFIASEMLVDPGGWGGAALIATWLVPVIAVILVARLAPAAATGVLIFATGLLVAFCITYAFEPSTWSGFESERGPVRSVAMVAIAAALLAHGLRRTELAGLLLLVTGAIPVALAAFTSRASTALLVASTPAIIIGTIYLGSALLADPHAQASGTSRERSRERAR